MEDRLLDGRLFFEAMMFWLRRSEQNLDLAIDVLMKFGDIWMV